MRPYSNAAGWSEVKFYVFTGEQDGHGVQWVGDHIRPRIRVPDSCNWPVGVSLPTEVGFQRAVYSPDTWTWEIRPIIDNPIGRWYFAINPALAHLARPDVNQGLGFSLNIKISYDFTRGQRRASGPMRDEAGGRPGLSQRPIACLRHRRPPAGMISSVKETAPCSSSAGRAAVAGDRRSLRYIRERPRHRRRVRVSARPLENHRSGRMRPEDLKPIQGAAAEALETWLRILLEHQSTH